MGSLWWILNGLCLHYQSSGPEVSLISVLMQSSLVTTRYLVIPSWGTQYWETMSWSMKDFPWNLNFFLYSGNITKIGTPFFPSWSLQWRGNTVQSHRVRWGLGRGVQEPIPPTDFLSLPEMHPSVQQVCILMVFCNFIYSTTDYWGPTYDWYSTRCQGHSNYINFILNYY